MIFVFVFLHVIYCTLRRAQLRGGSLRSSLVIDVVRIPPGMSGVGESNPDCHTESRLITRVATSYTVYEYFLSDAIVIHTVINAPSGATFKHMYTFLYIVHICTLCTSYIFLIAKI